MMTDNELDNLFKNTLGNHEAPIAANMWQRIQPVGKKKRPVVLWWKWYAAAAVFLIAGLATWWYVTTTPALDNTTAFSKNESGTAQGSSTTTNNTTPDASLQKSNPPNNINSATTNQSSASNKQSVAAIRNGNSKGISHHNSGLPAVIANNSGLPKNNNAVINGDSQSNNNHATDTNNSIAQIEASPNASAPVQPTQPAAGKDTALQYAIAKNTTDNNNNTNITAAANAKKNSNKKAKLPWTIEFLASSAYADKQTYDVVKEQTIGLAAPIPPPQPKPSLWSYNASVRLGIPVTKHLTLKTGLQFQQTRQNEAYQQQNVVDMVSINRDGDTSYYRQIVYQTENQKSTYNAINIPVLVAYQTGKKIQVGATAGVIVNAYSWYTGKVPNGTYSATLNAKDTYRKNTGASVYAGITIAKKVETVSIFAEPHLQYNISSITKPGVSFKEKLNTYGLSIGVRTSLHK